MSLYTSEYLYDSSDYRHTIIVEREVLDANLLPVLDSYGNKTYTPVDLSTYTDLVVYVTVKDRDTLVSKYRRVAGSGFQAVDAIEEADGKIVIDLLRTDREDLIPGDILLATVGYDVVNVNFPNNKFVQVGTEVIGQHVRTHSGFKDFINE